MLKKVPYEAVPAASPDANTDAEPEAEPELEREATAEQQNCKTRVVTFIKRHTYQAPFRLVCYLCGILFLISFVCYMANMEQRAAAELRIDHTGYPLLGTAIAQRRLAGGLGEPWTSPVTVEDNASSYLANATNITYTALSVPRSFPKGDLLESSADYSCLHIECTWDSSSSVPSSSNSSSSALSATTTHRFFFFMPGNEGAWWQGKYWSCGLQLQALLLGFADRLHTYAFHFLEQAQVHRGKLLRQQAMYVRDGVVAALAKEGFDNRSTEMVEGKEAWVFYNATGARAEVWLVGHSMGGIIAEVVAAEYFPVGTVAGLLTFNSPLREPPLFLDRPILSLYRSLYQHRDRLPSRIFTVTASDLDVQIESRTTYYLADNLYLYNTNSAHLCQRSFDHDDVLRDYCPITFASEMVLAAAAGNWSAEAYVTMEKGSALPPLKPSPWRYAMWGRWCWQDTVWPVIVSVYVGYVFAEGTVPLARLGGDLLLSRLRSKGLLPEAHQSTARSAVCGRWFLWLAVSLTTNPAVLCAVLFYLSLMLQWIPSVGGPPWGWNALAKEVPQWRTLLLSIGPVTAGIFAGALTAWVFFLICFLIRWLRVRFCECVLTPNVRSLICTGVVLACWIALAGARISFSIRAIVWFALSFVVNLTVVQMEDAVLTGEEMLRERREKKKRSDSAMSSNTNTNSSTAVVVRKDSNDSSAGGADGGGRRVTPPAATDSTPHTIVKPIITLFSFMFLIGLFFFFDLDNGISDWYRILDTMNYAGEVLLMVLFVLNGALPTVPVEVWDWVLQWRALRYCVFPVIIAASYLAAIGGIAYVMSAPVELCNMLIGLVCVAPAYIVVGFLSVASVRRVIIPTGEWREREKMP